MPMGMSLVLQVVGKKKKKKKYWTNLNFDLMMAFDGNWSVPVIIIHPEGDLNVSTEFNGIAFNSCWDIWFKTTNVHLKVALKEKSKATFMILTPSLTNAQYHYKEIWIYAKFRTILLWKYHKRVHVCRSCMYLRQIQLSLIYLEHGCLGTSQLMKGCFACCHFYNSAP